MPRVGEDLVTSCGKCKQRTTHVVFAMDGARVKRVQCKICLSYHNYHPEPDEQDDDKANVTSVRRRREGSEGEVKRVLVDGEEVAPAAVPRPKKAPAAPRDPSTRRRKEPAAPDYSELWNAAMQGKDPEAMSDYRPSGNFEEGGLVNHPNFGVGVVQRVAPSPERKMTVLFRDGLKTLVHRYGT